MHKIPTFVPSGHFHTFTERERTDRGDSSNSSTSRLDEKRFGPLFNSTIGLWLYGNIPLLSTNLFVVQRALDNPSPTIEDLAAIEREAEDAIFAGKVLVSGIHNEAHRKVAVVSLRWGSPRILCFSGGFHYHLGGDLKQEPARVFRLWRYEWDARTDLAVSRRSLEKLPTYATRNCTIDRLVQTVGRGNLMQNIGS